MERSKKSQPKDKKIASLKSILKEENPQKLTKIIERLEESEGKIDTYVARITGINIKTIITTRSWYKILKKIVIEEGKEVLETALKELEQELRIAEEQRIREAENNHSKANLLVEEFSKKEKEQYELSSRKANTISDLKQNELESYRRGEEVEKKASSLESLISYEVERIKKREVNRSKTAIGILFGNDQPIKFPSTLDEKHDTSSIKVVTQEQQETGVTSEAEIRSQTLQEEDQMIEDTIDLTTQSSKVETSNTRKSKRKQIEKTEESYETNDRNSLEDSLW